ncbi:MAG: hypothetical protein AB7S70_07380 [Hyphomicrobium sp.]|uniref:hypothetical protein n=1 Tax=Hyphomicrobium sp. TaxID=82 RepID=UPI003D0D99F1
MTPKLANLLSIAALSCSLPAAAAETVSRETPPPDACAKAVGALGAPMSHKTETAPDGRPIYRFVLRTNGLDYEAVCDAATGVVGDVTPRQSH